MPALTPKITPKYRSQRSFPKIYASERTSPLLGDLGRLYINRTKILLYGWQTYASLYLPRMHQRCPSGKVGYRRGRNSLLEAQRRASPQRGLSEWGGWCAMHYQGTEEGLMYLQSFKSKWLSGLQSMERSIARCRIFTLGSHACRLEDELASLNRKLASAQTRTRSRKDARDALLVQINWVKKEMINNLIWDHKSDLLGNTRTASQGWCNSLIRLSPYFTYNFWMRGWACWCPHSARRMNVLHVEGTLSYRQGSGFYQGSKRHIILKILLCSIPPTKMFHAMFHAYFTSPTIYLLSHHRLLHWYDNNIMSPIIWLSLAIARRVKTVYLLVISLVTSSVWQIFIILPKTCLTIILALSNQFIHSTWDVSIFVMFWTFYLPVFVRTMVLPGTLPKSIKGSNTR